MSIDLWLYDISNPHSDIPSHARKMKMREFSLFMRANVLAKTLGEKCSALIFTSHTNGKPYLKSDRRLSFNVSHSGSIWGMAVSLDGGEIGLDIENARQRKYMDKMMEEYFHPNEFSKYKSFSDDQGRTAYFYRLWTQKEAYAKYLGQGMGYDFSCDAFPADIRKDINIISGGIKTTKSQNRKTYISLACSSTGSDEAITPLGDPTFNIIME